MNSSDEEAYCAGWYAGAQRTREEARVAIGPRFFAGEPTLHEAIRRRERFMFWVRLAVELVFAIPGFGLFWMLAQYAHDLEVRCAQCLCITRTK